MAHRYSCDLAIQAPLNDLNFIRNWRVVPADIAERKLSDFCTIVMNDYSQNSD